MEVTVRLFILVNILTISGCSHTANDRWNGQDKAQHFIVSAVLATAGNEYAQRQGNSRDCSTAAGLIFLVSLDASRELWGSRLAGSSWSWKDFVWGIAGASTGYAVWQLVHY